MSALVELLDASRRLACRGEAIVDRVVLLLSEPLDWALLDGLGRVILRRQPGVACPEEADVRSTAIALCSQAFGELPIASRVWLLRSLQERPNPALGTRQPLLKIVCNLGQLRVRIGVVLSNGGEAKIMELLTTDDGATGVPRRVRRRSRAAA
jgi:hypothetical protein